VPGFVRPVAKDDERIIPHQKMTLRLGFSQGKYSLFAEKISDYMAEHFTMGMNIDGLTAAFLLDQRFTPDEVYQINSLRVASGVTACYGDQLQQTENSFLPLSCDDIDYCGVPPRTLSFK
jgi:citrate synthase